MGSEQFGVRNPGCAVEAGAGSVATLGVVEAGAEVTDGVPGSGRLKPNCPHTIGLVQHAASHPSGLLQFGVRNSDCPRVGSDKPKLPSSRQEMNSFGGNLMAIPSVCLVYSRNARELGFPYGV